MSLSISTLLRLPLASSRLLQDRHRLLRFFSTSPSPILKSSPRASTKPHEAYARRTTKKEFEKAIKELASSLPRPWRRKFEIQVGTYMEVFDVRIQRFDGQQYSRIYGEVTAVMGMCNKYFYNRPETSPESLHLGLGLSPILLTGPRRFPVTSEECGGLRIHIKDADTNREIIKGSIIRDDLEKSPYDRFILQEVRGAYGSAVISYAVFQEAVTANIEIKLLKGHRIMYGVVSTSNMYGVVSAWNTSMSEGRSVLFHREKEQSVHVVSKQAVRLSRSLVALPRGSDLNVRVELWDYRGPDCLCEIANTTVTFSSKDATGGRPSYRIISGQIKVTVTWTTDADL